MSSADSLGYEQGWTEPLGGRIGASSSRCDKLPRKMALRTHRWRPITDRLPELAYPLSATGSSLWSLLVGPRHPLHGKERFRPFFIIGSGRSGNTLLRRILQAHSGLHIPPENHALGTVITVYRRNRGLAWPHLVDLVLGTFQFSHGFEVFGVDLRPLAEELREAPMGDRNLAHVLDSFYRFHARAHEQRCVYWGDKTPLNTFNAFKIGSVLPDVRFIHIIRDGVDVVESYVRAGLIADHDEAARRWSSSVDAARRVQQRYPKQFLEIRYENLVHDPEQVIRSVCHFLQIGFEPGMLCRTDHAAEMGDVGQYAHHAQALEPISVNSVGKGRRELDPRTLETLAQVIGKQLHELGYGPAVS